MSTILSADDLNDFIAPGVACIKPVEVVKTQELAEIIIGDDGQPQEEGCTLAPAQISLQDCLACSGCITSSEAMLVELQSPKELLVQLKEQRSEPMAFVVSICPQTRVSLATAFNLSLMEVDAKLQSFFIHNLGFSYVVGTEIGRALALEETWHEYEQQHPGGGPILSSVCPGWTLYAEKTHPEVLSYLSSVRSPQQITGNLIKRLAARQLGKPETQIYHVSIMPCFDKKLEASRPSFVVEGAREVDLVITAKELVDLLQTEFSVTFSDILPQIQQPLPSPQGWPLQEQWKSNAGSSSGGYLAYVLTRKVLDTEGAEVLEVQGKNSDYIEYHVVAQGKTVFKGARVYGFRNIQNLVRKLKTKKRSKVIGRAAAGSKISDAHELDYVELMACPGGCVRGGGQIGAAPNVPSKVWTAEMDALYNAIDQLRVDDSVVQQFLSDMGVEATQQLLHTHFAAIKSDPVAAITVGTQW